MVEEGKSYKLKHFRVVEYENVQCVGQEVKSSQLNLLKVQLTEMRRKLYHLMQSKNCRSV